MSRGRSHYEIPNFPSKAVRGLGIVQVLLAVVCAVFMVVATMICYEHLDCDYDYYLNITFYAMISSGLFPILYCVSGGMAICCPGRVRKGFLRSVLSVSIVSCASAVTQVSYYSILVPTYDDMNDCDVVSGKQEKTQDAMLACLVAVGVLELVISIALCALCGKQACCECCSCCCKCCRPNYEDADTGATVHYSNGVHPAVTIATGAQVVTSVQPAYPQYNVGGPLYPEASAYPAGADLGATAGEPVKPSPPQYTEVAEADYPTKTSGSYL